MADKTLIILKNDPAKERKRLGKVKDLLEAAIDDAQMYEFDVAMGTIKKIKGGEIKHNAWYCRSDIGGHGSDSCLVM